MLNNDVRSTDDRFKTVNTALKRRRKSLEENLDLAKQFFEGSTKLNGSLEDLKNKINADQTIGQDKIMVRAQLKQHKVSLYLLKFFLFFPIYHHFLSALVCYLLVTLIEIFKGTYESIYKVIGVELYLLLVDARVFIPVQLCLVLVPFCSVHSISFLLCSAVFGVVDII